ncbi:Glycosyl-hydrolase 97 C-terminal, oligomerisation [Pedobacter suwonensis]|uniref:Glycosyl-hydrolase 97 C-terminal, oligomerisation n=1 Tax=Pedobacter suwonensis TaxID=332999 RepID=A0A1I0SMP3_9SPHI|nr:glycoside hydrolase family 97 protein [Pedobacter suwonensis]SFA40759.1 Glycosyl-hydrolase 97 C-terminal, oligomerisation [Pedobacter suwonensis]
MTLRKSFILYVLVTSLCCSMAYAQKIQSYPIISPNGKIKLVFEYHQQAKIDSSASAEFDVYYLTNGKWAPILSDTEIGIATQKEQFKNLTLKSAGSVKRLNARYEMISGKRKLCSNQANESTCNFVNANGKALNVIFRVYNDGIAFRYEFPKWSDQPVHIEDEYTTFNIPAQTDRWVQAYDPGYEDFYPYSNNGKGEKSQEWSYPALFKHQEAPVWYLISEAGNSEFNAASRLVNNKDVNRYKISYSAGRKSFPQQGDISTLPWKSQWHTVMIGSLATVVESTLITDVSEPSRIAQKDWIKPGAVAWIYWAYNHGSKDYQKAVGYTNLAKTMSWPYVLIDWEWDVMGNGGKLEDAVNYAKSKGIKPLIWYNSGTTDWSKDTPVDRMRTRERRIKEFEWLNKIGVYGIKVDFFAGDQQDMMKLYLDILKDAADHHLMVNFHGATIPRGWSRTYPNLMSVEAVFGAEWYNNGDVMTNKAAVHNTTLPFTRNVIGPMDYTPVTFSNSQHPHITSYGHELALSVVFESALQHFADRPEAYYALPDAPKNFLKAVPTAWDETRLLSGFPGKYVVMARRRGAKWYIGGLNGQEDAKVLQFNLDFLNKKQANINIIRDGENDKSFKSQMQVWRKGQPVKINCLPRGGFVAVVE